MIKTFVWIKTQFEGYHYWMDAPEEVAFLKNNHRHLFKIKVWVEVLHSDRDIEFFMLKKLVDKILLLPFFKSSYSCEQYSEELYRHLCIHYPQREIRIEFSEDGEVGSYIEFET